MSSFVQYINWFFQSFSEAHALDSGYKQKRPLYSDANLQRSLL